jgi:uncharacterized protein with GYD domain
MPTFMCQGRFTESAIRGMVVRPEDRSEPVAELMEKAGGRLLSWWLSFGDYDFVLICELPSAQEMASVVIAATAAGGVTGVKTMLLLTGAEAKTAFAHGRELSGSFRPAGREGPTFFWWSNLLIDLPRP